MKQQETVERHFSKVIDDWKASRQRKLQNLEKQRFDIDSKIIRLDEAARRIDAEIQRISHLEPPKAPTELSRESQRQTSVSSSKMELF